MQQLTTPKTIVRYSHVVDAHQVQPRFATLTDAIPLERLLFRRLGLPRGLRSVKMGEANLLHPVGLTGFLEARSDSCFSVGFVRQ
jgi:hypothetical protein